MSPNYSLSSLFLFPSSTTHRTDAGGKTRQRKACLDNGGAQGSVRGRRDIYRAGGRQTMGGVPPGRDSATRQSKREASPIGLVCFSLPLPNPLGGKTVDSLVIFAALHRAGNVVPEYRLHRPPPRVSRSVSQLHLVPTASPH